jgi:hypothetical protein
MKKQIVLITLIFATMNSIQAVAPVNFIRPYDINLSPKKWEEQKFFISHHVFFGTSSTDKGWNGEGKKVNDTQLWTSDQNALAMVKGYATGTELASIAQECNAIDGDDGIRGHFNVTGDLKINFSYLFSARYFVSDDWWVGVFVPVYRTEFKDVLLTDKTKSITADDVCTKTKITDSIKTNVATWGNGLSLDPWDKTGVGDIAVMAGWSKTFVQRKPWIKAVIGNVRGGVTLPTGVKKDEDKIMFMPFGNDGAAGIVIGAGLTINYIHRIDAGVDVELTHSFSSTKDRRIKVDSNQTEFLLLTKTSVHKDPGFMQKFTLFLEPKLFAGLSARLAYQHVRRGEDKLSIVSNEWSSTIANTAESLKEWTTHNVIAQLKWDTASEDKNKNRPELNVTFSQPFNGRRSVQTRQFGFGIVFKF